MKKIKIKKKFINFILIYLFLFTSYFSMITLSKYVGLINGSGTGTIAKWEVYLDTSENDSDVLDIVMGNDTVDYVLKLTSLSETIATYTIELTDVPNDLEVCLDIDECVYPTDNVVSFEDAGYINADASIEDRTIYHTLSFFIPIDSDVDAVNEISVNVIFVQKEPEGVKASCDFRGTGSDMITFVNSSTSQCSIDYFVEDTTPDSNYRFVGNNPNNYIEFSVGGVNELWRIIGVFDGKMKIVKANPILDTAYDTNNVNDWSGSSLKTYLNTTYYNMIDNKNLVDTNATWYLGSATAGLDIKYTRLTSYNAERDSSKVYTGHSFTTTAPIGLINVSDFGYATEDQDGVDVDNSLLNDASINDGHNWISGITDRFWTLNAVNNNNYRTTIVSSNKLFIQSANLTTAAYMPTLYLKATAEIYDGNGSYQNPYKIR